MAELIIRQVTEQDLQATNEIYNYYVINTTHTWRTEPEPIDEHRLWFADHDVKHPFIVALWDGRVVGWGALSTFHSYASYRDTAEDSVWVHQDYHRRGIGSRLLIELLGSAAEFQYHTVVARIDSQQEASIRLHEKYGFVSVGHLLQVAFKMGRWLDAIYMQRMV